MTELLIIADDFTGALDTGVQFSKNSVKTLVVLYGELDFTRIDESVQVVVVDTESRHTSMEEAAGRVRGVVTAARNFGVPYYYKKTDSALRGNIGSELQAAMEALEMREVMFVPAYPDAKRTTIDGRQLVDGVPVDATDFRDDPVNPVTECHIPSLLRYQTQADAILIGLERRGRDRLGNPRGRTIYVFDAETNSDMGQIARFLKRSGKLRLTAGCAGFAIVLMEALGLPRGTRPAARCFGPRMLSVCGSLSGLSARQVKYAESRGFASLTLTPEEKLVEGYFETEAGLDRVNRIARQYEESGNLIVKTVDGEADEEACRRCAWRLGIDEGGIPSRVCRNIGALVRSLSRQTKLDTLTVFGGDTTAEIVNALEAVGVAPAEEILTGVVLSHMTVRGRDISLVTKSGGFGEEDVLLRIREYLAAHACRPEPDAPGRTLRASGAP